MTRRPRPTTQCLVQNPCSWCCSRCSRGGDAAQLTTNYKRVGKRVEFGGSWLIRETFDDGVDAARAAAWLEDPRRVLAAAWPAEHIRASDGGGGDVLAFALTQDPIDFAGLPDAGGAAALVGSFEYSMSADLIGPLVFVPDRALRLAAAGVNRKLALGDRFADGVLAGVRSDAPS
ncbi:hypothetical protein JL722_15067 [Aureococcus anophagefferens]|nr:hypothetical protein JL722_15067 [Aureococcus anophagefferens]